MIWSYRTSDPTNVNSIGYHNGDRGSASVNLLGGLEETRTIPSDSKSFIVRNKNVSCLFKEQVHLYNFTSTCS